MGNSEDTKLTLLETSSILFNTQGYKSTSISDITFASGFTKGAIYKHFDNKSTLELESLKFMCNKIVSTLRAKIQGENNAIDKLKVVFHHYSSHVTNPIIQGGCPVLNASTEVDDTKPEMKYFLNNFMKILHQSVTTILDNGIKHGQLSKDLNVENTATIIFSALEGGIMMSKLSDDNMYIKRVYHFLIDYIEKYKI